MYRYIFIFCVFFVAAAHADVTGSQLDEVNHLLAFVKNSQCIMTRNGDEHSGAEGVKHIQRKYDYFRDKISSAEEFIEYSASKSTMSKKYYTVSCDGETSIKTQDWLLEELKQFRAKNTK